MKRRGGLAAAVAAALLGATAAAASGQTITTVAGNGQSGFGGDGGPATAASLNGPRGVSFMPDGGFVIADFWNGRVRRVLPDGNVVTAAGTGPEGYDVGGSPGLRLVHDVAGLPDGGFLIDDEGNQRILRVGTNGIVRTVAGTGTKGFRGDGGPATSARIASPRGIGATGRGGFLIADTDNHRVRCVTPGGTITTVAGNGSPGFSGDGGRATNARLARPFDVAPTYGGGFLIADIGNSRVRYVSPDGVIRTVAGNGAEPDGNADGIPAPGDGGSALAAAVRPWSVAALPRGGFLLADSIADRVRQVLPSRTITTAAGTGAKTSSGDGGPAPQAGVFGPRGLAVRSDGGVLVAEFGPDGQPESGGDRIRFVGGGLLTPFALPTFRSGCDYTRLRLTLRRRLQVRHRRAIRLRYRVTHPATVRLEIRKGRRRVVRMTRRARRGRNLLIVRSRLSPGRYRVVLRARTAYRQSARAAARLTVRRR